MCDSMLFARSRSAQDCACLSIVGSFVTGGRSASQRYKFTSLSAFARPFGDMSPALHEATSPLQVPSLMSARSAFQRAHTPSGDRSPVAGGGVTAPAPAAGGGAPAVPGGSEPGAPANPIPPGRPAAPIGAGAPAGGGGGGMVAIAPPVAA